MGPDAVRPFCFAVPHRCPDATTSFLKGLSAPSRTHSFTGLNHRVANTILATS
jgi:hypothetical protein